VKPTAAAKRPAGNAKVSAKAARSAAKPTVKAAAKRVARPAVQKTVAKPATKKSATSKRAVAKPARGKSAPARAAGKVINQTAARNKPVAKNKPTSVKPTGRKAPAAKTVAKSAAGKSAAGKQIGTLHQRGKTTPKVAGKSSVRKVAQKAAPTSRPAGRPATGVAPAARAVSAGSRGRQAAAHEKSVKPASRSNAGKSTGKPGHEVPTSPARAAAVATAAVTPPFKGRVASATAMVTTQAAKLAAHGGSHKHHKHSSGSMNKTGTAKLENGVTREDGRYALPSTSVITLPHGYVPSGKEEYMNPKHLAYFREKLRRWRDQLVEESRQTMDNLRGEVRDVGDDAERATRETENSLELRTRDRYRKLIAKIEKALRRIEDGTYGFCEETDEEIGLERLDARPIATLSLDAQERREHLQKQMGD
jgi:DnaK suppressor protein